MSSSLKPAKKELRLRSRRAKVLNHDINDYENKSNFYLNASVPTRHRRQSRSDIGSRRNTEKVRASGRSKFPIELRNDYPFNEDTNPTRSIPEQLEVRYERENLKSKRRSSTRGTLPRAKVVKDVRRFAKDARRGGPSRIQMIEGSKDCESVVEVLDDSEHFDKNGEVDSLWFQNFGIMDQQSDLVDGDTYFPPRRLEKDPEDSYLKLRAKKPGLLKRLLQRHRRNNARKERR